MKKVLILPQESVLLPEKLKAFSNFGFWPEKIQANVPRQGFLRPRRVHHRTDHEASRGLEGLGSGAQDPDSSLLLEILKSPRKPRVPWTWTLSLPGPWVVLPPRHPESAAVSRRSPLRERERLGVGHQTGGGARRSGCGQRARKNLGDDFSRASNPATSKPSGAGSQAIWTGEERWDLKGEEGRRPGLGNSVKRDGKPPSRGCSARWTLRAGVNPGKGRQRS